jgi:hypothetical protein
VARKHPFSGIFECFLFPLVDNSVDNLLLQWRVAIQSFVMWESREDAPTYTTAGHRQAARGCRFWSVCTAIAMSRGSAASSQASGWGDAAFSIEIAPSSGPKAGDAAVVAGIDSLLR